MRKVKILGNSLNIVVFQEKEYFILGKYGIICV